MLTRVLAGKIAAKNAVNLTYQVAVKIVRWICLNI